MMSLVSDLSPDTAVQAEHTNTVPGRHERNSIAFITTCKGRLSHLQQTLPLLMEQQPDEMIVVDYDCPQNAGAWAYSRFKSVKSVKVSDAPNFNLSRARNIGASYATSKWLCFIDADICAQQGWVEWLRQNLREGFFYTQAALDGRLSNGAQGTCVCEHSAYRTAGKYDEVLQGWGGEDDDFYYRLRRQGFKRANFPHTSIKPIPHLNAERTNFYTEKDHLKSHLVSKVYMIAKYQAIEFFRSEGELSKSMRFTIYREVLSKLHGWSQQKHHGIFPPKITITMESSENALSKNIISKKLILEININDVI